MNHAIGIDLGGTHIKGLAVTSDGRVLAETHTSTGDTSVPGWENSVRETVEQLLLKTGVSPDHIGIATPGIPARDQQSISHMPGRFVGIEGLVWRALLEFENPVPVLNDAQAALLGEIWQGAAKDATNAFMLTLGTGVGGAAMVDGHLLRGHLGRAGHLGHISLDPSGMLDITHTPGSLEDAIGGATLAKRSAGLFRETHELNSAVIGGNPKAIRIWDESVKALAVGIISLINVLDPETVIIGGGIAKAGPLLFEPLAKYLDRFEWRPGGVRVSIVQATLGDRAGAFGAAWNAIRFSQDHH